MSPVHTRVPITIIVAHSHIIKRMNGETKSTREKFLIKDERVFNTELFKYGAIVVSIEDFLKNTHRFSACLDFYFLAIDFNGCGVVVPSIFRKATLAIKSFKDPIFFIRPRLTCYGSLIFIIFFNHSYGLPEAVVITRVFSSIVEKAINITFKVMDIFFYFNFFFKNKVIAKNMIKFFFLRVPIAKDIIKSCGHAVARASVKTDIIFNHFFFFISKSIKYIHNEPPYSFRNNLYYVYVLIF